MSKIVKKLAVKKTFFITQLENFFSTISTEFNEQIRELEIKINLLEEENKKLKYDVKNLVAIKNDLLEKIEQKDKEIKSLQEKLEKNTQKSALLEENKKLKEQSSSLIDEIQTLKNKITNLQTFIKTKNAYGS